jgi:hypothetical protein
VAKLGATGFISIPLSGLQKGYSPGRGSVKDFWTAKSDKIPLTDVPGGGVRIIETTAARNSPHNKRIANRALAAAAVMLLLGISLGIAQGASQANDLARQRYLDSVSPPALRR